MMSATAAMTSSATAAARCSTTTMRCSAAPAPTRCSAAHAGLTPCRIALNLSALLDAAEGARPHTGLTRGCSVSSRLLPVPIEWTGRSAGAGIIATACAHTSVVGGASRNSAARTATSVIVGAAGSSTAHSPTSIKAVIVGNAATCAPTWVVRPTAFSSTSVVGVPVVKRIAVGVIPAAVKSCIMVVPIGSPVVPAPSKTSEEADSEPDSEREVRAVIPDSGIRVPSRPGHDGTSVNHPRIIRGDVNDLGIGRLNDDRRPLCLYDLLRSGPKIASFLRPLAHHLDGIHHILLLVVVGVT